MSEHEIQRELIDALLDGELEGGEKARVEQHLDECSECRAYADKAKRLSEALSVLPKYGAPSVTVDRIKQQAGMRGRAFWLSRTFISALSAAAAVIVVVAVTLTQYGRDEDLARRSAPAAAAPKEGAPALETERADAPAPAAGEDRMRRLLVEKRGWDKDSATIEEVPAEYAETGAFGKAAGSIADDEARPARKGWTPPATAPAPKPAAEPHVPAPQHARPDASVITGRRQEAPGDAGPANQTVRMKRAEPALRPSLEAAQPPSPVRLPSPEGYAPAEAPGPALRDAEAPEPAAPERPPGALTGRRRSIAKGIGGSGRGAGFGRERGAAEEKEEELDEAGSRYALAEREIGRAEKAKAAAAYGAKAEAKDLPQKKAAPRFDVVKRLTAGTPGEAAALAQKEARKLGYAVASVEVRNGRLLFLLRPLREAQKEQTLPAESAGEPVLADAAVQSRTRSGARRETTAKAEMVQAEAESKERAGATQTGRETLAAVTAGQRTEAAQPLKQATVVVDLIPVIEVAITPQAQPAVRAAETEIDAPAGQAAPAEKNE